MHCKPQAAREGVWRVRIKSHRERLKISGFIFFYKLFCVGIKWCVLGSMRVSHFNFCFVSCKLYLELFFILFCFIGRGVGNRRGFKAIIFNHIACMSSWTLLIPVIFLDFFKNKILPQRVSTLSRKEIYKVFSFNRYMADRGRSAIMLNSKAIKLSIMIIIYKTHTQHVQVIFIFVHHL